MFPFVPKIYELLPFHCMSRHRSITHADGKRASQAMCNVKALIALQVLFIAQTGGFCPTPEKIANGHHTTSSATYSDGDSVQYECDPGFTANNQTLVLTCGDEDDWNLAWPTCQRVKCGMPSPIPLAEFNTTGVQYEDNATFACLNGFEADPSKGEMTRMCQADGQWGGLDPECIGIVCNQVPTVLNANHTPTKSVYRYPELVSFICDEGFMLDLSLEGVSKLRCEADGRWNLDSLECTRVNCPQGESPENVNADETFYFYGDEREYQCKDGYEITSGDAKRTCQANGSFSGVQPECGRLECAVPTEISNALFDPHQNAFSYQDVVVYSCNTGYQFENGSTRLTVLCEKTGSWSVDGGQLPKCEKVSCLAPRNTETIEVLPNQDPFSYLGIVQLKCIDGYKRVSGDLTRHCQSDKGWSGDAPVCTGISCGTPPTGSGVVRLDDDFQYPKQVTFTCGFGYKKTSGSSFRMCQANGTWSGDPLTCTRIQCSEPATVNHAVLNSTSSEFNFGDVIQYECLEGFAWGQQSGDLTRICGTNRQFSGSAPKCTKIECGDPGTFPGTYKLGNSFKYGDRVNYTCANGYQQVGSVQWSVVHCGNDGRWNGTIPDCSRLSCGDPGEVANAYKNGTGYLFEDRVQYECHEGHYIETGLDTVTCTSIGRWNFARPVCEEVPEVPPLADLGPPDPPTESAGSEIVGVMGLCILIGTASLIVLLDLATIKQQLQYLFRNIKDGRTNIKEFIEKRKRRSSGPTSSSLEEDANATSVD